jgi:hypothetical protein
MRWATNAKSGADFRLGLLQNRNLGQSSLPSPILLVQQGNFSSSLAAPFLMGPTEALGRSN